MNIFQIVPRLPPAINGVGDYALNLACQLRQDFDIETHFIVGDPNWQGEESIGGFSTSQVGDRSAKELLSLLENNSSATVLLHYVGYGYAQRGCPVWLIEGLQLWQKQYSPKKLVTMFHEVYASSNKPWHSSFWLSPLQKKLANKLVELSDCIYTSNEPMAQILTQLQPNKLKQKIIILPVFSNVGEPKNILPLHKRTRQIVIFGTPGIRLKIYQKSIQDIEKICHDLKIEKIYDIGQEINLDFSSINNVAIFFEGKCDSLEVSRILQNSIAGFLEYPENLLEKSGIFAAYCSHQIIPIFTNKSFFSNQVKLAQEKYYWHTYLNSTKITLQQGELIAKNAFDWYQKHNLKNQAKFFYGSLLS